MRGHGPRPCDDEHVRRIVTVTLIVGFTLLAGCSAWTAPTTTGVLTGGIYNCGGFSDSGCPGGSNKAVPARTIPGTVVVSLAGHRVASVRLREGERYRFSLRPGAYTVSAGLPVSSVRAVVAANKTTTANMVNQIP